MTRKDELLALRSELTGRRDALRRALAGDTSLLEALQAKQTGADPVDAALDDMSREIGAQLAAVEGRELVKIEYALERMRDGLYGLCEGCNANIPITRLRALPYATRCISCQRGEEQSNQYHQEDSQREEEDD